MPREQKRKTGGQTSERQNMNRCVRSLRRALVIIAMSAVTLLTAIVLAAPGDLDPTFSVDGKVRTSIGAIHDIAWAVALQPDGKIVVAGSVMTDFHHNHDFAIVRYNADGSLDTTFDTDGKVTTNFGAVDQTASDVAIQSDGKIVVAGTVVGLNYDFAVARYNPDGSLDTTFDGDGKVTTDFGADDDQTGEIALQPDGKIIVAGHAFIGADYDFAVARYNTDGSLDTTFDADGKVTTDFGSRDIALTMALQPDGKIVAAGQALIGADYDFAVARYNTNGSLDSTFDSDGKITTDFIATYNVAVTMALQPDGKIIVAGFASTSNGLNEFAVARYNPNGTLDTTFDGDGKVMTDRSSGDEDAMAIGLQPDGKIVAAGSAFNGVNNQFALARYNADGSLDTTFGLNGKVTTAFGTYDVANAVAIQPDGKIIAAGYASNANSDFALARYLAFTVPNRAANFDADRKTDIAVSNSANRYWYLRDSATNTTRVVEWGNTALGDRAVPGDYDGDGKTDVAVFRPSEGNWYIIKSSDNTVLLKHWGGSADFTVAGDYDLDGKTDPAVWRPSDGNWYVLNSRDNTVTVKGWGKSGDKPVPADYDGDGATDFAVYRALEGNWYIITSKDRFSRVINWGNKSDRLVPADYDGDGRVDVAVFRPAEGTWYIRAWTGLVTVRGWGDAADVPVPADYDGDGRADIAIYRPSELNWYIIQSATNSVRLENLGQPGTPVPAAYLSQ